LNNNKKKNINVIKKEAGKILNYKDLTIEIQRMWNVREKVITVKIVATGTISKSLRQNPSNKPGKHGIKETQKNSNFGHCTCTAGSANVKVQTYLACEITLHVAQIVITEQLQHCIP
jgi:hypothetical protein